MIGGVRLALDGLGRGRLSLDRFDNLPLRMLKIEHRAVHHSKPDLVLEPLLALAKNLQLTVAIQGLETRADCKDARRLGCDLGQGFFFSQPLDSGDAALLARSQDPIFWAE